MNINLIRVDLKKTLRGVLSRYEVAFFVGLFFLRNQCFLMPLVHLSLNQNICYLG